MPAHDRQPPAAPPPRLPDIDEPSAAPLSSLFGDSFDLAAVESAAQLADSSIFITSSGSRFRLQRIPETAVDRRNPQLSASAWGGSRPASASSGASSGAASGASHAARTAASTPESVRLRAQHRPQHQHGYQPPMPPRQPPPPPPSQDTHTTTTSTVLPVRSRDFPPTQARASPALPSHDRAWLGLGRRGWDPQRPQSTADDLDGPPRMMANISDFGQGFGASALYLHSDGGVQAAETLTDSETARRLEYGRGGVRGGEGLNSSYGRYSTAGVVNDDHTSEQPYRHSSLVHERQLEAQHHRQSPQQRSAYRHQESPVVQDQGYPSPQHYNPSYSESNPGSHHSGSLYSGSPGPLAATPLQDGSGSSLTGGAIPDPFSPPAYGSPDDGAGPAVMTHNGFGFSSYPPDKPSMAPRSQSLPSLMEESSPVFSTPQPRAGAMASPPSAAPMMATAIGAAPLHADLGDHNGIDTLTPIVVRVHSPPSSSHQTTVVADSFSATRDNVLPGEEVLYDGFVKTAHTVSGPFEEGHLKVFRNNLTHDIRFHCKAGNNTDTHWMKGTKAQMVPVYAYDSRSHNLVYIRDNDGEKRHNQAVAPLLNGPSAIYQFAYLQDLFKFQSQLTGESVVLDISSVKWIRLARANSRSSEMYSSVRLQIWHEPRSRKTMQSDQASFVTAGTALSGPMRERTVPNSSRLMVFLGRSEEYITSFITDDIEMEPKGHMSVRLKPRKYSGVHKRNSRAGIRARLETKLGTEPAGLSIHGEQFNLDVEQSFEEYKTFEIEFESSPSQVNFVQAWNEVIEERRKQRMRLARIQEDMRKETFSPKEALSIKT